MNSNLAEWLSKPRPALIAAVASGISAHVHNLRSRGVEFYGYALLPGDAYDIHSLVAATNTEGDIQVPPSHDQYRYYRYSVDEWAHYDHDAFAEANALLIESNAEFRSMHTRLTCDAAMDDFELAHASALLECILKGLEVAKFRGVFGKGGPFLVVWVSDSDSEVLVDSVKRLNSRAVLKEFEEEFGS